jgi:WD40 repeat protein
VLGALVDARLLTSFEREGEEAGKSRHEIEIVHESLLSRWPRLVRWQTQDADGAQLRDQLRQAAQAWQDRGRAEDLLWSGTAYRDLSVWRERYSGGLSATEEAFARAAERRAGRRRRRRRWALAGVVTVAAAVATTTSVLWRQADAQARRAEASELLALGRLQLEDHPTNALAYAIASLERADTQSARRFALETLHHGAPAYFVRRETNSVAFSHDGRWLATGGPDGAHLWSREGGAPAPLGSAVGVASVQFDPQGPRLMVKDNRSLRILSVPDGRPLLQIDAGDKNVVRHYLRGSHLFTLTRDARGGTVHARPLGEGEARLLGRWDGEGVRDWHISPDGAWLAYPRGRQIFAVPLEDGEALPRRVGEHPDAALSVGFPIGADRLLSSDRSGEIRIWSVGDGPWALERTIQSGLSRPGSAVDRTGSTLITAQGGRHETSDAFSVWDLNGPPDAGPAAFRNGAVRFLQSASPDPQGHWLAMGYNEAATLWPLGGRRARIIRGQAPPEIQVAFTPDGTWLASFSSEGVLRLWPLSPAVASGRRTLMQVQGVLPRMAVGPKGRHILVVVKMPGRAVLIPLDGGPRRELPRFQPALLESPAISPDGRLAAAGTTFSQAANLIEVWDLESGEVRTLDPRPQGNEDECADNPRLESAAFDVGFTSDGRLLSAGLSGLRLWNLDDGTNTLLRPCAENRFPWLSVGREDRFLLRETDIAEQTSILSFHDLRAGASRELTSHGNAVRSVALDAKGEVAVTGGFDGVVRVGTVTDEEPHLLYGHDGGVTSVAVSPDGQWIASASQDGTIRLWPMPEGRPFHTLPYDEILGRLRSFTNLRVVRDEDATTGYSIEPGLFPGWAVRPEW